MSKKVQEAKHYLEGYSNIFIKLKPKQFLGRAISTILQDQTRLERENIGIKQQFEFECEKNRVSNNMIGLMAEHMINKGIGINNIDATNITSTMYSDLLRQTINYFESKAKE